MYLVTGGAGFIGSNIVKELVSMGEQVRVIDNFATGKKENIKEYLDKIELVEGDIRDAGVVKKAVEGIDYILHQAALPSVPRSIDNPLASNENNITGTLNVLIAAKEAGVKRVVIAASSSAYGNTKELPKHEGMKTMPLSPYAVTKHVGEQYGRVFYRIYGLETVCLRYFNVFGPNQDPESQYAAAIPNFITAMLKNEPPVIYGDGEQSRDFTYVENVVNANLLATKAPKEALGEVFNIACGDRITVNSVIDQIKEVLGSKVVPNYNKDRIGDVKHSLADISKAVRLLNYKPEISFKEGLRRTIEWYKNKQ